MRLQGKKTRMRQSNEQQSKQTLHGSDSRYRDSDDVPCIIGRSPGDTRNKPSNSPRGIPKRSTNSPQSPSIRFSTKGPKQSVSKRFFWEQHLLLSRFSLGHPLCSPCPHKRELCQPSFFYLPCELRRNFLLSLSSFALPYIIKKK